MQAGSQMHPWQPGECAEQSKQPLWAVFACVCVCVCVCVRERERETAFMRPP